MRHPGCPDLWCRPESDAAALIPQASSAGTLAAVSYTPPGLEEVFMELVGT